MIRVGILFGGASREREVSFAGGRTVYDNLDKHLFQAIPLFTDSFGNLCELDWQNIYKGSIRDFYPPVSYLSDSPNEFQVYAESLDLKNDSERRELLDKIGRSMNWEELREKVDFVFLALHGPAGEDGSIQGMLEWLGIPYSGSGILPSAIGISKITQKNLQQAAFNSPKVYTVSRREWISKGHHIILAEAVEKVGFPMVVKSANQGSSIGVSILKQNDFAAFSEALDKSFFSRRIKKYEWKNLSPASRVELIRQTADIREGIGMPLLLNGKIIRHPEQLLQELDASNSDEFLLEALDTETEVLIERFIEGREFSCIVVEDEQGRPFALPPTEIVKNIDLYDYRSKYLPGLSRKVTPIDIAAEMVTAIREECVRLYKFFGFHVYARIDGFINKEGQIFLNDPNTTSGMMPSSFFFHQAAEVGLNPSQFLTYIIRNSLAARARSVAKLMPTCNQMLKKLDSSLNAMASSESEKQKIAVVMGGYSSERHISVESGRNIYEKLSSSEHYQPVPVFLTGDDKSHSLHLLPINIMLKDNADDILEKVKNYKSNPVLEEIRKGFASITSKYNPAGMLPSPKEISYEELAELADGVFIALHGRPGEDGVIQGHLEKFNLPYNGSGVKSSQITINKYETNEILSKNGFHVAGHLLVYSNEWKQDSVSVLKRIGESIGYPLIAKPADDGCSSAVKKIKSPEELGHFAELMFREDPSLDSPHARALNLKTNEEFPCKNYFLVEQFVEKGDAEHFLEVTGGLLTHRTADGKVEYEMFEPSETLAESDILSLEEKFLAGQGQNITPARFSSEPLNNRIISEKVRAELKRVAEVLNIEGYCRIDAFVKIYPDNEVKVYIIEVNSLPGMTPATCIFHQCAINGYKPFEFIDAILHYGFEKFNSHDKAAAH